MSKSIVTYLCTLCDRIHYARGYCHYHYAKLCLSGEIVTDKQFYTRTKAERFWRHVTKTDGCWLWTGATDKDGYGRFAHDLKTQKAHRASWELHFGPIPDGLFVLHHCDNPPCTRPSHLFTGTMQDNVADQVSKNRQVLGEKNGKAKLTANDVKEILLLLKEEKSNVEISRLYNVSPVNIGSIKNGAAWPHINRP